MADGGEVIFKFKGDDKELSSTMKNLSSIGKTAFKGILATTGAVATGVGAIVTASVKARGEMEQLEGGTKKIFDEMDFSKIEKDAQNAYKTMNLSASEYMDMMNKVGATFAQTMGDEKGYNTAKTGLQAIADYASGTGADINTLNDKFKLITRSTSSYQSIADQFAGILPQTTKDFLEQAQASGYLSQEYKKLTDVPVAEYQEAVTKMLEQGVDKMGLLGNTTAESTNTLTGSLAMARKSWENFLSGKGSLGDVADSFGIAFDNILAKVNEAMPQITEQIIQHMPQLLDTGMKIISAIGQGIIDNLPMIIDTAMQIIMSLIEGITEALPDLIPKIVDIIVTITNTLVEHAPEIIEARSKTYRSTSTRNNQINTSYNLGNI